MHLVFVHGIYVHGSESEWVLPHPQHTHTPHPTLPHLQPDLTYTLDPHPYP